MIAADDEKTDCRPRACRPHPFGSGTMPAETRGSEIHLRLPNYRVADHPSEKFEAPPSMRTGFFERCFHRLCQFSCDIVLNHQGVMPGTIIGFRPGNRVGSDQSCGHSGTRLTHASIKYISDAQLVGDIGDRKLLIFEIERRSRRGYPQAWKPC